MAANTSKGITYPTGSDMVDNLLGVFSTMANSIDTTLGNYIPGTDRASLADVQAGTSSTKVVTPKALADAGFVSGDTGWQALTVTAATGFAVDSGFVGRIRKVGNLVQIRIHRLTKTAASPMGIPVTGNMNNRRLLSGIPPAYTPSVPALLMADASGRANSYLLNTDGTIDITAMVPASNQTGTVNCPTGEQFSCGGVYLV